jgi:hypothetical protein
MRTLRPGDSLAELSERSLFLAGPTPRAADVVSWRPEALATLDRLGFEGDVLAPEPFTGDFRTQVEWERDGLERAARILFWVPRDLERLPGFTTNVEFGRYVGTGRTLYGRPPGSPKTRYLDWLYREVTGNEPHTELESLLRAALSS